MYHGFCNRGGCHVDAKNSTAVTTIPRAVATGHLKVVTRAHVTTIEVDGDGRTTGVNYVTDGVEYFQPAKAVLLASFTYENSRLLLLSKSKAYPNGLSNNHTQVGRHYFSHHQGAGVTALFPFNLAAGTGLRRRASPSTTGRTTISITRALISSAAAICGCTRIGGRLGAAGSSTFGRASRWGSAWKAFIKENAIAPTARTCRRARCRTRTTSSISIPAVKDPLGYPVCRVTAEYKDNERKIAAFIQDKMERWVPGGRRNRDPAARRSAGRWASRHTPMAATRMGDSPDTNVVNRWGFSHEAPNLGILGASVMGTSGARNPTLTAQALAWRTAEYLVKNWNAVANPNRRSSVV